MAIIGVDVNKENPEFTIKDFLLYAPRYKAFMATEEGQDYFNELYTVANNKVFYSVFGTDWKLAMTYCILHYLSTIAQEAAIQLGPTLQDVAANGSAATTGVLTSASVGAFSKSYDLTYTTDNSKEAMFWNTTKYGAKLWALFLSKGVASIFVVTSGPITKKKTNGWW